MKTKLNTLTILLVFLCNVVFAQSITKDANENITQEVYNNLDGTITTITYTYDKNGLRTSHTVTTIDSGLPIGLLSFKVTKDKNGQKRALVVWTTSTEKDNAYFVIEHSLDAQNFESIGQVASKNGNSITPQSYEWTHKNPVWGSNYYRLRQVDTDGTSTVTKLQHVFFEQRWETKLYPNPTQKDATLEISGLPQGEPVTIKFWNLQGKELSNHIAQKNDTEWTIQTTGLSKGIYIVEVQIGNARSEQKRLIVQ